MNTKTINGAMFADMIRLGAKNISEKKEIVNELNVFPVPDGDTGDNMAMTIGAAAKSEDVDDPVALGKVAETTSRAMLLGARGNSGVILSRIFAGIANGLADKIEASVDDFSTGMKLAVEEAYGAVGKPVEGTILTVLRDGVGEAQRELSEDTDFEVYFEFLTREMRRSVDRTPELLPSLKEAGVVDSGGVGLLYIFEGMQSALSGEEINTEFLKVHKDETESLDISLFTEDSELEFGYCTEFLLRLQNKKINIENFNVDDFTEKLKEMGESVVCFRDDSIVKVHIHIEKPGEILNFCQNYGEFLKLKIENMSLQHNNAVIRNAYDTEKIKPKKKYGTVTIANGEGIINTFRDLGCDVIIPGGQSMNPATSDFLEAFDRINAETIFVFPNNKNIFMAASQAAENTDKNIKIVETKTIGEGYAAISMLDETIENPDELFTSLNEVISNVVTGQVSRASRNANFDSLEISSGDYIGFSDKKILTSNVNRKKSLIELAEKLDAGNFDLAILFFGENVPDGEAREMENVLKEKYPRLELYLRDGKQPIYDYILILE